MKTGTVRVSEEFIKPDGTKKWYAHEKQYNQDTEDPQDVFATAESEMNAYVKKSSQVILDNSIPPGPPPVIQIKPEDRRVGVTVEDILSCNDIPTIDSYRLLIKDQPLLQAAYDKRREEIKQAEIADIMRRTNEITKNK